MDGSVDVPPLPNHREDHFFLFYPCFVLLWISILWVLVAFFVSISVHYLWG